MLELYFDNKNYDCYHEKIDGLLNRRKFRIRTYSSNKKIKSKIFLEIKGRYNNLVYKDRTPLNDDVKKLTGTYINDYLIQQLHKSGNKKILALSKNNINKLFNNNNIHETDLILDLIINNQEDSLKKLSPNYFNYEEPF